MDYLEIHSLYHHGVKGQRWGVRRYQNEDGTLTEEGKERYSKLDRKFRQNVLDVESRIATANLHNLQSGRKHDDDDYISESIRKSVIRKQKVGKKMLKKLLDSGYMQQQYGFDPKKVDYSSFMQAIENVAAKEYISKYGKFRISEFDSDGSEDYELAILDYTTKQGLAHVGTCDIEELYHHGIKGQKWGIRRYQNEDGSLTPEGKKRYGANSLSEMSPEALKQYKLDRKSAVGDAKKDLKAKKLSAYSDLGKNLVSDKYGKETLKDLEKDQEATAAKVELGTAIVGAAATMGVAIWFMTKGPGKLA